MDRFILHEIYGMSAEERKRFDLGQYADDGSILEDTVTGETYMDGWEPEDATFIRDLGWVPALLNTLAAETATQRAEIERLTAELEEARLTLAAEQGRAEGAPSDGWVHYDDPNYSQIWEKRYDNGDIVRVGLNGIVHREMCRRKLAARYSTARAAMLAADASK
jgi:hypothetical protein